MYNPQLETFLRVADAGSFNKAAEAMFISPPAVIKQINLLESQLEVTLFDRSHRGLTLTEAGKSLYRDARYIITYCKDSVARAQNAMKKFRQRDPYRYLSHDSGTKSHRSVAQDPEAVSGHEISDHSL